MTNDFSKYVELKTSGALPNIVVSAARSDGMNEISLLRMLRDVYGVSLADAKQLAVGGDVLAMSQDVEPGNTVYWEGWTSTEGFYVMEATVTNVIGDIANLQDHKRYLVTDSELCELPISEPAPTQMRISDLQKPLGERLSGVIDFVEALADCSREAG